MDFDRQRLGTFNASDAEDPISWAVDAQAGNSRPLACLRAVIQDAVTGRPIVALGLHQKKINSLVRKAGV